MPIAFARDGAQIFYKDWGHGLPVIFSHGWPLTSDVWDSQLRLVASRGYRAIAHDRRGHGRSSQTWDGHDMDTYADYMSRHGSSRVRNRQDREVPARRRQSGVTDTIPG
jgi:non-heme chloroperoxidase